VKSYTVTFKERKVQNNSKPPKTHTFYVNRAPKLVSGLLSSVVRKGGNFNEADKDGRIPLLSLAELASAQRNIFTTGTFAELALSTSAKHVPLNWSLTGEEGNSALHWLFSGPRRTASDWRKPRRGAFVQEFARMLCRDTAAAKAVLAHVDLLAENDKGESIIRLIADHCLHPRSRRHEENRDWGYRFHGMFWPEWGGDPMMPPERFPNCLRTHEKLYLAWMQLRAPFVKSVVTLKQRRKPPILMGDIYLLTFHRRCPGVFTLCFRREVEVHLIPDLANIVSEYLRGLTEEEKLAVFGVSADERRKAQEWYTARAREVHQWPLELHEMQDHWDALDDAIDLGPLDEHPFHSSADEAECSQRPLEDDAGGMGGAVPPEPDLQAAEDEIEGHAVAAAAAPILEAPVAMELDD
jgi:hypothetical protein